MFSSPLKILERGEARLHPVRQVTPMAAGIIGGLYSGETPTRFRHQRFGAVGDKEPSADLLARPHDRLAGCYIYAGPCSRLFGHMVAEFSHRLWVLEHYGEDHPPVLLCGKPDDAWVAPWVGEILAYLGVRHYRLLTRPTIVERLIIPQQAKQMGRVEHPSYRGFLKRVAARHGIFAAYDGPKKIAILRDHLQKRRLVGEGMLADHLASEGYTLYRPEEHSFVDQLRTLANADKIIIADGTPGHLFDLLPWSRARVFVYGRRRPSKMSATSIAPKAASLHAFLDMANLALPRTDKAAAMLLKRDRRLANRPLLYAPLSVLTQAMQAAGFIDHAQEDALPGVVVADIRHFIRRAAGMGAESGTDLDDEQIDALAFYQLAYSHFYTEQRLLRLKRQRSPRGVVDWIARKLLGKLLGKLLKRPLLQRQDSTYRLK